VESPAEEIEKLLGRKRREEMKRQLKLEL